ncbi:unnamed protein product [Pleuronectes platessa]|uniref:Uncharacterized protein n=1 Tax=Pleuronectes platessa TaxID=8262 RepID=A0A9N7ZB51_PLEPL|nr:unnamed protein product [Pleuronectes platessa]
MKDAKEQREYGVSNRMRSFRFDLTHPNIPHTEHTELEGTEKRLGHVSLMTQFQVCDLLLQSLLKLFVSTHFSFLLGSDLLLHIGASFLQQTVQLSEDLLAVLHGFISRAIDGLYLC